MTKKLLLLWVLGMLVVGCRSKKAFSDRLRTKNVLEARRQNKNEGNASQIGLNSAKADAFVRFEIASIDEYIDTFAKVAQEEMKTYGVPASITLAQGLLESGYGKGELALKTNNHFGIKCHTGWEGDYDFHDDDEKGECFRKYNHPMHSFRDHSLFLTTRSRYRFLFEYAPTDYEKWAKGLKKAGYATDNKYPHKLIYLIEKYGLYKYDKGIAVNQTDSLSPLIAQADTHHIVKKGDTLYSLSKLYFLSVEDLMRLNNLQDASLSVGQKLTVKK